MPPIEIAPCGVEQQKTPDQLIERFLMSICLFGFFGCNNFFNDRRFSQCIDAFAVKVECFEAGALTTTVT